MRNLRLGYCFKEFVADTREPPLIHLAGVALFDLLVIRLIGSESTALSCWGQCCE